MVEVLEVHMKALDLKDVNSKQEYEAYKDLDRELQVARRLQTSLIPRDTPRIAGWDFVALWPPARIVRGDFYDFVPVHHVSRLGIVIADVSDKGMPAALFMAWARSTIRASITGACYPADCVTHANRVLCTDTENGMFVTMCYAQLNPATGELVYVNAGHNPPLLYRRDGWQLTELARTGMVLGVDDTHCYEQRTLQLDPGDFVVFYTDGVTEAANITGQEFGKERLRQVVLSQRGASAVDIIAALRRAIDEFVGSTPSFDDVTTVVVKRL